MIGVGVDLVDLGRAGRLVRRHPEGVSRFLSLAESRLWKRAKQKTLAFALIFAAKEAASKSVGESIAGPSGLSRFRVFKRGGRLAVRWIDRKAFGVRITLFPFTQKNLVGMLAYSHRQHPSNR